MIIFRRSFCLIFLTSTLVLGTDGHALGSRSIGGHAMAITKILGNVDNTAPLATDAAGNLYLYDLITLSLYKITPSGVSTFIAGNITGNQILANGRCTDGTGAAVNFPFPVAMVVSGGNLYMADYSCQSLRKVILNTGVVTTLFGTNHHFPTNFGGIVIDSSGNFFTSEVQKGVSGGKLYCDAYIFKTPSVGGTGSVFVGPAAVDLSQSLCANTDGTGSAARFISPQGLVIDQANNIFVADSVANNIRKITPAGIVTTFAGCVGAACASGTLDGAGSTASFSAPTSMTFDAVGNAFVVDAGSKIIRKISSSGVVRTVMGKANSTVSIMSAMPGQFSAPGNVSFGNGKLYFADYPLIYSVPEP